MVREVTAHLVAPMLPVCATTAADGNISPLGVAYYNALVDELLSHGKTHVHLSLFHDLYRCKDEQAVGLGVAAMEIWLTTT